jgi:hypothetical protein
MKMLLDGFGSGKAHAPLPMARILARTDEAEVSLA